eukprot:scaffold10729_cov91-Skeletonema_dohrnii-CCMP3373.AAC.2
MMLRHTGTGPSRHLLLLTISFRSLDQLPIMYEDGDTGSYNYPDELQIVNLELHSNEECSFLLKRIPYGKSYTLHNGSIFDSMICSSTA